MIAPLDIDNVARRILAGVTAGTIILTPNEHAVYTAVFLRGTDHRPAVWTGTQLVPLDEIPVVILDVP